LDYHRNESRVLTTDQQCLPGTEAKFREIGLDIDAHFAAHAMGAADPAD
jgi:hypothetical protein